MVYLQETENELSIDNDPISFSDSINDDNSDKWLDAMKDELKSMAHNDVWDLIELPEGCKRVGCKWVFKTKSDSHGNIELYKARLVAKGFTQKDGIDYKETFSPVSKKDSFRIIMALGCQNCLSEWGFKRGCLYGPTSGVHCKKKGTHGV